MKNHFGKLLINGGENLYIQTKITIHFEEAMIIKINDGTHYYQNGKL
jgi:hypothetical protein